MTDIFDIAQVVRDTKDLVDTGADAQRRKPIGFWRAMIAIGAGALWIVPGIIPGIPVMISANRWMKGKSRRPLVAMICGFIAVVFLAFAFVYLLFGAAVEAVQGHGIADGSAAAYALAVLAGAAGLAVAWFVGRYLFSPYEPRPVPQDGTEIQTNMAAPS